MSYLIDKLDKNDKQKLKCLSLSLQLAKKYEAENTGTAGNRIGKSSRHNDPSYYLRTFDKPISKML